MPRPFRHALAASALALLVAACAAPPARAQGTAAQAPADEKSERGMLLLSRGDVKGALPLLRDAAEARKGDADAWQVYGVALNRAGRAADARKAFERALRLRPDWAAAHAGRAYALLRLGKARDARSDADRALALDPDSADAHFLRGVIHFETGNPAQAAADAEAALRINPALVGAALLRGEALLNAYADESARQFGRYPLPPASDAAGRKAAAAKHDAALESFKDVMLVTADRLEALARARPDDGAVPRMRELAGSLRMFGERRGEHGVYRLSEVTTPAVITHKPEPGFTEEARRQNVTGQVRLRAVLGADGRVRHVVTVRPLPAGLTDRCVEVARRIRFTPATVNGTPVSQFVIIEYHFKIY